jgi:hypothetical protein
MTLPKQAALGSLADVVKQSRESAEFHFKQLHSFQRFADMAVRLVRKQAPDLLPAIRYIIAPFTTAVNHETAILHAESRAAEDLNDLSARYDVLWRQWSEYSDINKRVREARDKITKLRRELDEEERKGGPKQYKLKGDIAATFEAKKRAVEEGQAKLEQIIATRQSYFAFSVRRLKHAYSTLGNVIEAESRGIAAAFGHLQNRINEVRENVDGILDGTYTLPEVAGVPSAIGGEEEDEEGGRPGTGNAGGGRSGSFIESKPVPDDPAPYVQEGGYDDSPFPPE